jgi:hypothetical protein
VEVLTWLLRRLRSDVPIVLWIYCFSQISDETVDRRNLRSIGSRIDWRMGIPIVIAALVAAVTALGPTSSSIEHYSIEVPAGYEAKDVSPPMMDFEVYRVARQHSNGVACGLYLGNAPGFPKLRWSSKKPVETKGDGRITKAFERPGALEGLIEFSGLTYKDSKIGSPFTFIHYWCDKLDEGSGRDMLKMIASIKVARAHLD